MKRPPSLIACFDRKHRFRELFNPETGFYLRTGILERVPETRRYIDTGIDPFLRFMPSMIDIGVMGRCIHGRKGLCLQAGVECYQSGSSVEQGNMSLEDFRWIIGQIRGKTFQCALGGRGDPNKHENFEELLACCRENDVVPNYTSSGLDLTDGEAAVTKKYVGAVAVSFYNHSHTFEAIDGFLRKGIKTNIHYVLSDSSIDDAIDRLRRGGFPKEINAVIYLLHKPVGSGTKRNVLKPDDERIRIFFDLATGGDFPFKIGFDTCSVPGILNYGEGVSRQSIEACEAGRFSCYISPGMVMAPCSFDQEMRYGVDLRTHTIEEGWNSEPLERFRALFNSSCPSCDDRSDCLGGCPLLPEITLCDRKHQEQHLTSVIYG